MAAFHARTNSLPSRPHPLVSQFDEQLSRIRDSQATSTSSSSSICHKLSGLEDLHYCVDKLLQLPLTQQSLVQNKSVDEVLNGSLALLDLCNTAKDALLQANESLHEIQSVIRRRQGGLDSEIRRYMGFRKVVKKAIKKASKNKSTSSSINEEEHEIITMLREVQAISLSVFESLLSFISEPKSSDSKRNRWSIVGKLMMHQKRVASCDDGTSVNEFAIVDVALASLVNKTSKPENAQNQLRNLESCIEDLERGVERLFRRMIKTRVSLPNIFSISNHLAIIRHNCT